MAKKPRPPVITIMGHVDHGKTSLLDYIRKTRVAAREAGGITQHIGAYQTDYKGSKLTFIDTPGHAAFNKMRERGAKITDIVILVVAANDGVKPQTIESIRHIKNSNATVVVAINKMDLKDAFPDMVKSQLVEHGISVQGFGGDVDVIELSAITGEGVDKLLETLVVMGQLNEYSADPDAPLQAVVIESSKDAQSGSTATVIVQDGTLTVRQDIYTDTVDGRVKLLTDDLGKQMKEATPGTPVQIIGFSNVPAVGALVRDVNATYPEVTEVATEVLAEENKYNDMGVDDFFNQKPKMKLILRADVEGTLEAIMQNFDEESVELLNFGVGSVTESDVEMAKTTKAVIIAFNVKISGHIKRLAKDELVKIKQYDIIYQLIEDLQKQMLKLLEPSIDEIVTGEAEILQIFEMKSMKIAGVKVKTGEMRKIDLMHLIRNGEKIANPVINSMMHGKEEISSVKAKNEAGFTFKNKRLDFQPGDILQAYKIEDDI